jgi:hypothetical protein
MIQAPGVHLIKLYMGYFYSLIFVSVEFLKI